MIKPLNTTAEYNAAIDLHAQLKRQGNLSPADGELMRELGIRISKFNIQLNDLAPRWNKQNILFKEDMVRRGQILRDMKHNTK